jgi:hypothetical protein
LETGDEDEEAIEVKIRGLYEFLNERSTPLDNTANAGPSVDDAIIARRGGESYQGR